jgi:hypothetical protein
MLKLKNHKYKDSKPLLKLNESILSCFSVLRHLSIENIFYIPFSGIVLNLITMSYLNGACMHQIYLPFFIMKKIILFSLVSLVFGCFSCDQKNELEHKIESLMNLHDDEMAKMDLIFSLKKELKVLKDSSSSDSLSQVYTERILSLEQADEAMMNWMRNYKVPDIKEDMDKKLEYYDQEHEKMAQVKVKMNQSIDSAKIVLQQNK